MKEHNHLP